MKIYVGADHNGYRLKELLEKHLNRLGYDVADDGDKKMDPADDFPVFAQKVVKDVLSADDKDARGILLCGSGQGMCMTANRFKGIRAALLFDYESARSSRNDDNSNIACLPANSLEPAEAFDILETWLNTPFEGARRFVRRIQAMDEMN
ncbi:MAG: RpiB/LacA/LacB family sugar-phosphate isomerase [Candidatus Saccharibacteria bacterium]|nr:RpiB/LacA/LacB family sugar-phosphate isomerase [Candidatus Saccharibacteria bacterium]